MRRPFESKSGPAGYSQRHEAFPLTPDEQGRAQQLARRLRSELGALVAAFPPNARTSSGMARAFGVNRTICHRLLSALSSGADELEFLTKLPGVQGLRTCVARAREGATQASESDFGAADSAVDAFAELIESLAGSHSRLAARVEATRFPGDDAGGDQSAAPTRERWCELRRQIHDAVAEIIGRTTGVRASLSLVRPMPEDPERIEYVHVRAYTGHRVREGAPPMLLSSGVSHTDEELAEDQTFFGLDGSPLSGRTRTAVIQEFSGDPAPVVTTRDRTGRFTQVIDAPPGSHACSDLVLAYRVPSVSAHPALQSPPILCETLGVREPVRRIVMDLYLHRTMTAGCKPSMSMFIGNRDVECDLTDRWFDRIESSPVLTLLGPGIHNAASEAYTNHAALTRHVFTQLGWDPDDFVGYRCDEEYPQWGCDYVMAFDYRDEIED
ncbi:MAG: hypothetical protein ACF8SC_12535 [Phycisphaerales bacterium JB037]